MGLIAWYPLNGDTNDYSGNNFHATNNSATINTDGKLGQSYTFTNGADGINIVDHNFINLEEYTMAAWVNPAGNHRNYNGAILSSGNWNAACWSFGLSQNNTQVDVASSSYNKYINYTVPINQWTHILCVVKTNISKLYINGNYINETYITGKLNSDATNTFIGRETYANGYFAFNGKLNDIRIYDHALSALEIKKLAQGKILHYSFNNPVLPKKNILVGGEVPVTTSVYNMQDYTFTEPPVAGDLYTISLKGTLGLNKVCFGIYNSGGSVSLVYLYPTDRTPDGVFRQDFLWTIGASSNTYLRVYQIVYTNVVDSHIEWIRLEKKQIEDISGFGNHGNIYTPSAPVQTTDCAVGNKAFVFNNSQYIDLPNTLGNTKEITVSAWFKKYGTPGNSYHIIFGGSEIELSVVDSGQFRVGLYISGVRKVENYGSGIVDGNWHMLTTTYDGSIKKVYIDGLYVGSATYSGYLTRTISYRRIGVYGSTLTYFTNGAIDDVRIYATALSAEDIYELYKNKTSLNNGGILTTASIGTGSSTLMSLNSTGHVAVDHIITERGILTRYIKDSTQGSNKNSSSHWVEIEAYEKDSNVNVALGKSVFTTREEPDAARLKLATDGSLNSSPYVEGGLPGEHIRIDLGAVYNIHKIKIWHYWADGRIYNGLVTEVSRDEENWLEVFNSDIEGTYAESSSGKTITLPTSTTINKMGINKNILTVRDVVSDVF